LEQKMISLIPEMMEARAPYNLLNSICAPRPITWISTIDANGIPNLAPFSYFNAVAGFPPTIMFSVSYRVLHQPRVKDTLSNVEAVGEFVAHVVDEKMADTMILTAADWPIEVNEFEIANIESLQSIDVKPPRVAAAPVAMECKVTQIIPVEGSTNVMVLGRVVRFHVWENLLRPNGLVNTVEMKPIARLGGPVEYTKIGELFYLKEPGIIQKTEKMLRLKV
jgi:flavin reductase (DIM6/NTAB) family NADH-FMN oxidoreductase RutF